jgi:hypothetical protein
MRLYFARDFPLFRLQKRCNHASRTGVPGITGGIAGDRQGALDAKQREVQEIIIEDAPALFLNTLHFPYAARSSVKDIRPPPTQIDQFHGAVQELGEGAPSCGV